MIPLRNGRPIPGAPPPDERLHPLDAQDRAIVLHLITVATPSEVDIVQAARLLTRYRDSLLSHDLYDKLLLVLETWGLTTEQLNERSRAIWLSGWRPTFAAPADEQVGSGADVEG